MGVWGTLVVWCVSRTCRQNDVLFVWERGQGRGQGYQPEYTRPHDEWNLHERESRERPTSLPCDHYSWLSKDPCTTDGPRCDAQHVFTRVNQEGWRETPSMLKIERWISTPFKRFQSVDHSPSRTQTWVQVDWSLDPYTLGTNVWSFPRAHTSTFGRRGTQDPLGLQKR